MSGESIAVYGATVNIVTTGASVTNTSFSTAVDSAISGSHSLADIVFTGTFAIAPAAGGFLKLYRRDLNIESTNDEAIPDASYKHKLVAVINLDVAATNYVNVPGVPLSPECEFYIENSSGQTLNAGWKLNAKPFGYGAAP